MKIHEVAPNITYKTGHIDHVTPELTRNLLSANLYVDLDNKQFKKWWEDPESFFKNGGIFSIAYDNSTIIGVGTINIKDVIKSYNINGTNYVILGTIGFFVNDKYRNTGIAKTLARNLEKSVMSTLPAMSESTKVVVFASGVSHSIVSFLDNIITHQELNKVLDSQ
jgi:hypothetical protein